jgi:glycosyltransferase involved in cell wall biosynthesis
MTKRIFVSSTLSAKMLDQLKSKFNRDFEQISLGFLKNSGIISLIKVLRSTSDMHVVLENEESEKLYDIFLLLFLFTRSKTLHLTRADLSHLTLKKIDAIGSIFNNFYALIIGCYCTLKAAIIAQCVKNKKYDLNINEIRNILYLKSNFWFGVKAGGSVGHIEGVIGGFKKKGFNVDYASVDISSHLKQIVNNFFPLAVSKYLSIFFDFNLFVFDHFLNKSLKNNKYTKYSFVYHRHALNSLSGVLLSKKLKIPLILEYNGSEVWVQKNWGKPLFFERVSQSIENANLRYAHHIVTVSEALREELIQRGLSKEKIICYPNCVDPQKFNIELFAKENLIHRREQLGFSKDDVILTFVGTFGKWHGVEVLAHTIRKLFEVDSKWLKDKHVKFLLIGDGACMPEAKNILSPIPRYSNVVTLTGLIPQEDTPAYLALSDILISPHFSPTNKGKRFFGSPTKLFEYMAMGKVIIASDLEQISEVLAPSVHINNIENIDESSLAILSEPGNIDSLQKAIKYAVDNYSKLQFMGHNAHRKTLENYTWERHVEEIINRIQKCDKKDSLSP